MRSAGAWLLAWLGAFVFTQAVECPLYAVGLRRRDDPPSWPRAAGLAFVASTLTHPVVWFVIPPLVARHAPRLGYTEMVVIAELYAVTAEALYLWWLGLRRAWAWSVLANGASLTLGLTSRYLFGWP